MLPSPEKLPKNPLGETYHKRKTPTGVEKTNRYNLFTEPFIAAAKRLGIKVEIVPDWHGVLLKYRGKNHLLYGQAIKSTFASAQTALSKIATKRFLEKAGIKTPKGFAITKGDPDSYVKKVLGALKKPVVVKPSCGMSAQGVATDVKDFTTCKRALKKIFSLKELPSSLALIEEGITFPQELRVVATRKRCIGVMWHRTANVIGDGESTIRQLVRKKNTAKRASQPPLVSMFRQISLTKEIVAFLHQQGKTVNTIPRKGQVVWLQPRWKVFSGGDFVNITNQAHPSLKRLAVQVVRAIPELEFAGLDIFSKDAFKAQNKNTYSVTEVNHSPFMFSFYFPYDQNPLDVAGEILKDLIIKPQS